MRGVALHLRTGVTDITGFPASIDGVAGIRLLNDKWPQGTQLTLDVVVTQADQPDTKLAIERLTTDGLAIPGLSRPVTVTPSRDGKVAMVSFTMAGGQNDPANRALVRTARSSLTVAAFAGLPGVRTYVTGDAAYSLDVTEVYANGTPTILNKSIETQVLVRDGGTAVLGGVYVTNTTKGTTGVPFLMRLPILGALFRTKSNAESTQELLIFITPRILHQ